MHPSPHFFPSLFYHHQNSPYLGCSKLVPWIDPILAEAERGEYRPLPRRNQGFAAAPEWMALSVNAYTSSFLCFSPNEWRTTRKQRTLTSLPSTRACRNLKELIKLAQPTPIIACFLLRCFLIATYLKDPEIHHYNQR